MASTREPIFNVPAVIVATIAVLVLVHTARVFLLTPRDDMQFLLLFSFIPARYDAAHALQGLAPGGRAADVWTFVTYALIHGDITHLGLNVIWLLAFGTAVARRFRALRLLAFFAITAAAGAAAHLVTHAGEVEPMVGASATISGCMAAAIRFVFQAGGPLGLLREGAAGSYRTPVAPLTVTLRDPRVLAFLAVWFGLNVLLGLGSIPLLDGENSVAWEAHIGGFLAGLLLFAAFDPVGRRPRAPDAGET